MSAARVKRRGAELDKRRAELNALSTEAKTKAEAELAKNRDEGKTGFGTELPDAASISKAATATFSAAGLVAASRTGTGAAERTVNEVWRCEP